MSGIRAGRNAATIGIELYAEMARLQKDLDQAKRMMKDASGDIAKNARYANDNLASLSGGMARSAPSAKQAAFGMRNLAFQAQDLGVQFAMAANSSQPLKGAFMALIMQGPQIKDAIDQTGKSLIGLVAGFARAHPLLLALTVAIGAAAAALKLFQSEIEKNAELDAYAASLGLTSEEMKKLEGVGITTTDMFKGLWRTIDQGLGASEVFASIKAWAVDTFKTAMDWSKSFGAAAYAVFAGTGNAALAMGKAAKLALSGDFAGALATIQQIPDGYRDAFDNAKKAMDGFLADWRRNTIEAAKERISAQASKLIDERKIEKEGKEKGSFLADVMSGAFLARWALEMSQNPIVDMQAIFSGRTLSDAVRAQEEVQRQKEEGDRRLKDFYEDLDKETRNRFMGIAQDFADVVGGGIGRVINSLLSGLDRFAHLFNSSSPFMRLLGGAGLGGLAGNATGGSGVGGSIGGAIGGKLGEKFLTKGLASISSSLGQFAGPIGSIAGGILGGVVGGLLKKTKKASATIEIMAGDAMQSSLTGNSSKLKATAGAMADSLIGGLMSIADQLGGMLGDGIRVSIGQRNKKFRVDLQGLGRTKNMPSFDTQEEAVAYAIQEVIRQGAIVGLRAGTETLLKGQGDLEAQLQKALSFENVFREIEQRANPVKASMSELTKQFENLIDIFEEAGASAADYAQLQQLMADKQREIIEQAFEPIRTMLDDLKAKATEAGDKVRTAFDAVIQREADAVAAYQAAIEAKQQAARQKAIESLQDSLSTLRSEAQAFGDAATRLRDFSASVFGTPSLAALRANFARTAANAQGGNIDALGALPGAGQALRDAVVSNASDRLSMVRELNKIRIETDKAASMAEGRATTAERQAAAIEKQLETMQKVEETTVSIEQLAKEMQTAQQAADLAREQMAKYTELNETELSFAEAVAEYEAAKASRDDLMRQITTAGFADLITAQQKTGDQLIAALQEVAITAQLARSQASDAIAAAQAAQAAAAAAKFANDNLPWLNWMNGIPGFAAGGMHSGGLRIVGENGPEIEATGPARYYSASDTAGMLGGATADEIRALRDDMRADRDQTRNALYQIAKNTGKTTDQLKRWDGDGTPPVRDVA